MLIYISALHLAVKTSNVNIVRILLNHEGINTSEKNEILILCYVIYEVEFA